MYFYQQLIKLFVDFPQLLNSQVALIRAHVNTGVVLDEDFQQYITGAAQTAYSVFNTYDEAIAYTRQFIAKPFEFIIYNHKREVLAYIT